MMKYLLLAAIILPLTMLSCKRKPMDPDPYIDAMAGKFPFYTSGAIVQRYKTGNALDIEGVMNTGATLHLWVKNFTGALDSLSLDSTGGSAYWLPNTPSVLVPAVYGKLVFTSTTPFLKGRFAFTCTDSTKVTGDFSIKPL